MPDLNLPPELQDDPGQAVPAPEDESTPPTDDATPSTDDSPADEPQSTSEPERRYAGRFGSIEDLERAYKELQGEYTRVSQANAWAKKLGVNPSQGTPSQGPSASAPEAPTQSSTPQSNQPSQPQPDLATANKNFMRAFTRDPLGTMAQLSQVLSAQQLQPLMQSMAHQQAEAALRELDGRYPGVTRDRVAEILQAYPGLENAENGLELAYTLAAQELTKSQTTPTPKGSVAPQGKKAQDRAKSPEESLVDEILKAKPLDF